MMSTNTPLGQGHPRKAWPRQRVLQVVAHRKAAGLPPLSVAEVAAAAGLNAAVVGRILAELEAFCPPEAPESQL